MNKLLLSAMLLAGLTAHGQTKKAAPISKQATIRPVDIYYGFREFKFESAKSLHPELFRISSDSTANLQIYQKPDENLSVGGNQLTSVKYVYYKDKLQSILISVSSASRHGILQAFKTKYGTPTITLPDAITDENKFVWQGQKALIFFAAPDDDSETSILLQSKIMRAKEERDAASDL